MANIPKPEALGVCESVPSLKGRSYSAATSGGGGKYIKHPWGGVILQNDLVDDAGPRLPELDSVLLGRAL
jgi:hypothetical protein